VRGPRKGGNGQELLGESVPAHRLDRRKPQTSNPCGPSSTRFGNPVVRDPRGSRGCICGITNTRRGLQAAILWLFRFLREISITLECDTPNRRALRVPARQLAGMPTPWASRCHANTMRGRQGPAYAAGRRGVLGRDHSAPLPRLSLRWAGWPILEGASRSDTVTDVSEENPVCGIWSRSTSVSPEGRVP
jgi:hypothetical protein